jgi:hypothetical protein
MRPLSDPKELEMPRKKRKARGGESPKDNRREAARKQATKPYKGRRRNY